MSDQSVITLDVTKELLRKKTTELVLGKGTFRITSLGLAKAVEFAEVKESHRVALREEQKKAIKKLQELVRKAQAEQGSAAPESEGKEDLDDALDTLAKQAVLLDVDTQSVIAERDKAIIKLYKPYCDKLAKFINAYKIEGEDIIGKDLYDNYDLNDINALITILETGAPPSAPNA